MISRPSCSSTRNESYILRTFQSIPEPMSEATSFGVSTTESGPAAVLSLPTLVCPDLVAACVGAPTDVSAVDGSAWERPNQCATVLMIGRSEERRVGKWWGARWGSADGRT